MKELLTGDNRGLCSYYCMANAIITLLGDYEKARSIINKDNFRTPLESLSAKELLSEIKKEKLLKAELKKELSELLDDEVIIIPNGFYGRTEHAIMVRKEGGVYYSKDHLTKEERIMSLDEIRDSINNSLTKRYIRITIRTK